MPIPPDLLARIHAIRDPKFPMDEDDDPTIPHTVAWFRERNRAAATAAIPPRYADATTDRADIHDWVIQVLTDPRTAPSLLLRGSTGTGKTHTAYAALRLLGESCLRGMTWTATSTAALYGDLRPSAGRDSEKTFTKFMDAPLLLLDDLGAAKSTEWTEEVTYRLIDHRYNQCLPSIFTSNARKGELSAQLGDRTASRLTEMCHVVAFEGADLRRTGGIASVTQLPARTDRPAA
jgi:DNA replication protein DnaC